uniref:Uncharacterized protein n=1 Tax=Avena sativa TaxID=4498 RepID=A0ACD5V8B1_AVESA
MKRIFRRLSRVAAVDSSSSPASANRQLRTPKQAPSCSGGGGARVPQGHVPVCVGEEGGPVERFAVRADLLGRPAFAALLMRAAQEYGYGHPGALRIPCPVAEFRRLLVRLSSDPTAAAEC